jgi:hypothetical protein
LTIALSLIAGHRGLRVLVFCDHRRQHLSRKSTRIFPGKKFLKTESVGQRDSAGDCCASSDTDTWPSNDSCGRTDESDGCYTGDLEPGSILEVDLWVDRRKLLVGDRARVLRRFAAPGPLAEYLRLR